MIDGFSVLFATLWIFGAAIILATLSTHHWIARQKQTSFRTQLNQPTAQRWLWSGITLIAVGLAGNSQTWWQTAVYLIVALFSLVTLYITR